MFETDAEVDELQRIFDRTLRTANPQMQSIVYAAHTLSAARDNVVIFRLNPVTMCAYSADPSQFPEG